MDDWMRPLPNRNLQQTDNATSLCFCPIDTETIGEKPTFKEFQSSVQAELEEIGSTAQISQTRETNGCDFSDDMGVCPSGQLSFECSSESTFATTVVVDLQYSCPSVPDLETLSLNELRQISDQYVTSYNQLQVR
jgi:hypothetical protein